MSLPCVPDEGGVAEAAYRLWALPEYGLGVHVKARVGSLRGDSDFTVALLARQASPPLRYAVLASKDIGREGAHPFRLELYDTGFVGFVGLGIPRGKPGPRPDAVDSDGYSTALTSRRKLELSAWTHIAVTRCGTAFTLYIDGSPDTSLDVPFTQDMNHDYVLDLRIGSHRKPYEPSHPVPVRPMFGAPVEDSFSGAITQSLFLFEAIPAEAADAFARAALASIRTAAPGGA